jgi:hypothetical protein
VLNGTFYEDSCSSSSGASRMVGVVDYVVGYSYEVVFCEVGFRYKHDVYVINREAHFEFFMLCEAVSIPNGRNCRNLAINSVCFWQSVVS